MKLGQTARVMYLHKEYGTLLCEVTVTRRKGFFTVADSIRGREILGSLADGGKKYGTFDTLFPGEIKCYASDSKGEYRREVCA